MCQLRRWQILAVFLAALYVLTLAFPQSLSASSCAAESVNLTYNGSMREGGLSPYGPVADRWNAFIMNGEAPYFDHVDNEGIDPQGSQYIWADQKPFDAGIYQVVQNLQPGEYYHFWLGYALAAYDNGDSVNRRYDQIGRMVGVDPTGGTDPHSPNVQWGSEFTNGVPAVNIPALDITFAAQADHVTVYARAINHSSQYRNKVWFDMLCMKARADLPAATPNATATPTATSIPPTDTPRPTRVPITLAPTNTSIPPTEVPTNTPQPTATLTNTPRPTSVPTDTATPRRPIPTAAPGATNAGPNVLSFAVLLSSVGFIGVSVIGMLALGAFFLWRMFLHRPVPAYARSLPRLDSFDEMEQFDEAIDPRISPDEQLPDDIY